MSDMATTTDARLMQGSGPYVQVKPFEPMPPPVRDSGIRHCCALLGDVVST